VAVDAVRASAVFLPSLLVTRLLIVGAGAAGGTRLDFLIAAAERRAV